LKLNGLAELRAKSGEMMNNKQHRFTTAFSCAAAVLLALTAVFVPNSVPRVMAQITNDLVVGSGSAASCSEAEFDAALAAVQASGGGNISFNCGGAATITFSAYKLISSDITINGGGIITLSGNNATRHFVVDSIRTLRLNNITLQNGNGNGGSGGAIDSEGSVVLTNVKLNSNQANGNGGAISIRDGGLTVTGGALQGNSVNGANGRGGAISAVGTSLVTISGTNISLNAADIGGGIYADSRVDIQNGLVAFNSAVQYGGGINLDVNSNMNLRNTDVRNNSVDGSAGICNGGGIATAAILVIDGGSVSLNAAINGNGGGICNAGNLSMSNNRVEQNVAEIRGAGIYNYGTATISNTRVQSNTAKSLGGGIFQSSKNLAITSTIFSGNQATYGGGMFVASLNGASVSHSTFYSNIGGSEGGAVNNQGTFYAEFSSFVTNSTSYQTGAGGAIRNGGVLNVVISTFANNSAAYDGGAISNSGDADLASVTLFGNQAKNGSTLSHHSGPSGVFSLANTILGRAQVVTGGNCYVPAGSLNVFTSKDYNISNDASCAASLTKPNDQNNITDLKLGALADYGGRTLTFLPAANSPVIDTGNCGSGKLDQRELPRPLTRGCDIGAVERQTNDNATPTPAPTGAPTATAVIARSPTPNGTPAPGRRILLPFALR
jgi:hypothetical protein